MTLVRFVRPGLCAALRESARAFGTRVLFLFSVLLVGTSAPTTHAECPCPAEPCTVVVTCDADWIALDDCYDAVDAEVVAVYGDSDCWWNQEGSWADTFCLGCFDEFEESVGDPTVDDPCADFGYCWDPSELVSPGELDDWGPSSHGPSWSDSPGQTPVQGFSSTPGWRPHVDVAADPQSAVPVQLLPPQFQGATAAGRPAALLGQAATAGDPVELGSGAQVVEVTDLRFAGPVGDLAFTRRYSSQSDDRSLLGSNWTFAHDVFLEPVTSASHPWAPTACVEDQEVDCRVLFDGGRRTLYVRSPAVAGHYYVSPTVGTATLEEDSDGSFYEEHADGRTRWFDPHGYLRYDEDRFGNRTTIDYEPTALYALYGATCGEHAALYPTQDPRFCEALAHVFGEGPGRRWQAWGPLVPVEEATPLDSLGAVGYGDAMPDDGAHLTTPSCGLNDDTVYACSGSIEGFDWLQGRLPVAAPPPDDAPVSWAVSPTLPYYYRPVAPFFGTCDASGALHDGYADADCMASNQRLWPRWSSVSELIATHGAHVRDFLDAGAYPMRHLGAPFSVYVTPAVAHGGRRLRPTRVTDPHGRQLVFEYHASGVAAELLARVTGPGGAAVEFDYGRPDDYPRVLNELFLVEATRTDGKWTADSEDWSPRRTTYRWQWHEDGYAEILAHAAGLAAAIEDELEPPCFGCGTGLTATYHNRVAYIGQPWWEACAGQPAVSSSPCVDECVSQVCEPACEQTDGCLSECEGVCDGSCDTCEGQCGGTCDSSCDEHCSDTYDGDEDGDGEDEEEECKSSCSGACSGYCSEQCTNCDSDCKDVCPSLCDADCIADCAHGCENECYVGGQGAVLASACGPFEAGSYSVTAKWVTEPIDLYKVCGTKEPGLSPDWTVYWRGWLQVPWSGVYRLDYMEQGGASAVSVAGAPLSVRPAGWCDPYPGPPLSGCRGTELFLRAGHHYPVLVGYTTHELICEWASTNKGARLGLRLVEAHEPSPIEWQHLVVPPEYLYEEETPATVSSTTPLDVALTISRASDNIVRIEHTPGASSDQPFVEVQSEVSVDPTVAGFDRVLSQAYGGPTPDTSNPPVATFEYGVDAAELPASLAARYPNTQADSLTGTPPSLWATATPCEELGSVVDLFSSVAEGPPTSVVQLRQRIRTETNRICTWTRTVDRDGDTRYHGLSFSGAILADAWFDEAADEWHVRERLLTEDGRSWQLRSPGPAAALWSADDGYVELSYSPAPVLPLPASSILVWRQHGNLARRVDHPRGGLVVHQRLDEDGALEAIESSGRLTIVEHEPVHNQLARVSRGYVDAGGEDVLGYEEVYRYADACPEGPVYCPDCDVLATSLLADPVWATRWEGLLERGSEESGETVDSQVSRLAEELGLPSVEALLAPLSKVQPVAAPERTCTLARPHRLEIGRPGRGKDRRYVDLDWSPHGLPRAVREIGGVSTEWSYHRSCLLGPDPTGCEDDGRGPLASITLQWIPDRVPFPDLLPVCEGRHGAFAHVDGQSCDDLDGVELPPGLASLLASGPAPSTVTFGAYDGRGLPGLVTQNGVAMSRTYDADGRLLSEARPWSGESVSLQRDARGRVMERRLLADGQLAAREVFLRDAEGRVTTHCSELEPGGCDVLVPDWLAPAPTAPQSRVSLFSYSAEGRPLSEWAPGGLRTDWTWDAAGRPMSAVTSASGTPRMEQTWRWCSDGRLTEAASTDLAPDAWLPLTSPGQSLVDTYEHDGLGRLTRHVSPTGLERRLGWTAAGDVSVLELRPADEPSAAPLWYEHYAYDLHREPIYQDVQGLASRSAVLGPWGRARVSEATGRGTTFSLVDRAGARVFVRDAVGDVSVAATAPGVTSERIATRWSLALTHGAQGVRASWGETALESHGLPTQQTLAGWDDGTPVSRTAEALRDGAGRLLASIDAEGRVTEYGSQNLPGWAASVCREGVCSEYTYESRGLVTSVTDPDGETTAAAYDAEGRLVAWDTPSSTRTWAYDGLGRPSWTSPDGIGYLGHAYDDAGRLDSTQVLVSGVASPYQAFGYDALGRLAWATQWHSAHPGVGAPAISEAWTYDGLGRVQSHSLGALGMTPLVRQDDWTVSGGRWARTSTRAPASGGHPAWLHVEDEVGRLHRVRRLGPPSDDGVDVTFSYQGGAYAGREQLYGDAWSWSESVTTNALGELTALSAGPGAETVHALAVTRSPAGRAEATTWSTGAAPVIQEVYEYDALGRLAGLTRTTPETSELAPWLPPLLEPPSTETLAFERTDAVGSLVRVTRGHSAGDPVLETLWESAPRLAGHRLSEVEHGAQVWPITHDPAGRIATAGPQTYTWDIQGRLVAVHDAEGAYLEGYAYTTDGRLAGRLDETGALTSQYTWDLGELVAEHATTLVLAPGPTATTTTGFDVQYTPRWEATWGPGIHRLVEWWHADEPGPRGILQDARRSVAAVTVPGGPTLALALRYDPDGRATLTTPDGVPLCEDAPAASCPTPAGLPFAFGTSWRSEATGLSWMHHRWHSPALHQFLSPDPLGYVDAFDPYAYAAFDPINGWDPWGLANAGFASDDEGSPALYWVGYVHGLAPPGVSEVLDAGVAQLTDGPLAPSYVEGQRNGAVAGIVASGLVAAKGAQTVAASTGPAIAACAAGGGPSFGASCGGMAVPAAGLAMASVGALGVDYYGQKAAGLGTGQPMQMSRGDGQAPSAGGGVGTSASGAAKGGRYKDVRGANEGGEVHHMPADSVSPVPYRDGPSIIMETADHRRTASHGHQGRAGAAYRARQKQLIEEGRFDDAVQLDIDDVRSKFGDKYDDAILEMIDSLD